MRRRKTQAMANKAATSTEYASLTDFDRAVLKVSSQKLRTQQNGKTVEIGATEAVLRKQMASALSGGAHAQHQFLEQVRRSKEAESQRIAQEIEEWTAIKAYQVRLHASDAAPPETDPTYYPHPEDICIERDKGVRLVGPQSPDEMRQCHDTLRFMEACILQAALDRAQEGRRTAEAIEEGDMTHIALLLNTSLPVRMRLSIEELAKRLAELAKRSKRDLLRDTYQAWRRAGRPRQRGSRGLERPVGKAVVGLVTDMREIVKADLADDEIYEAVETSVQERLGAFIAR